MSGNSDFARDGFLKTFRLKTGSSSSDCRDADDTHEFKAFERSGMNEKRILLKKAVLARYIELVPLDFEEQVWLRMDVLVTFFAANVSFYVNLPRIPNLFRSPKKKNS